jgi:hypothetical protein
MTAYELWQLEKYGDFIPEEVELYEEFENNVNQTT